MAEGRGVARCWAGRGGAGTVLCGPLEILDHGVVVDSAQHLLLNQAKFLARGQLALAREAGKTGQMVGIAASPPHPVAGVDLSATPCALGPKSAVGHRGREGDGSRQAPFLPPNPSGLPVPRLLASGLSLAKEFPYAWIQHPPLPERSHLESELVGGFYFVLGVFLSFPNFLQ